MFINNINIINSNQAVNKYNICKINNKEDTVKHAIIALIKPLDFVFKK